jgi:transcriptional regulator with XRE-family HTH domain
VNRLYVELHACNCGEVRTGHDVDSAQFRCQSDGVPENPWPLGQRIAKARTARGIKSARAAAKLAKFDEATWRRLESGKQKIGGVEVPYIPTDQTVVRAAHVVGEDPGELLALLGRGYDPDSWPDAPEPAGDPTDRLLDALEGVVQRLEELADRLERND